MEEPFSKDLGFGLSARLDPDGTLTLMEVARLQLPDGTIQTLPTLTQVTLPAQATRSLHNFLRTETARTYTGYRRQKDGKRHVTTTNTTRQLGGLRGLIRRWLRK